VTAAGPRLGSRRQLLLDAITLCYFLPIGITFVVVPRFVRESLGGDDFTVGLATTIFFLSAIVARPLAGRWTDRHGRRRFVVWPLFGMAVTTLALSWASTLWMVVAVRILQGAVGASLYTALAATATDLAPAARRGAALARLSVFVYLGFAIGPFLGESLFDRSATIGFGVAAALMAAAAALAWMLPETRPVAERAPVDVPVASMLRAVLRPGSAQFCVGFGYACLISFLTKYSREIGLGSSGTLFLTFAVCTLLVRAASGPLGDRIGYAAVALPGLILIAVGLFGLAIEWEAWVAFPAIALVGVGFGSAFPALTAIAAQRAPDSARGAALGAFLTFNDLGNALAGPLVGWIADTFGFRWAYGTPAIVACAGAVVCASLLRNPTASAAIPAHTATG
jgi:MFS family permease